MLNRDVFEPAVRRLLDPRDRGGTALSSTRPPTPWLTVERLSGWLAVGIYLAALGASGWVVLRALGA